MSDNLVYIVAAYAVLWAAIAGYRLFLGARRREARELVRKEAGL